MLVVFVRGCLGFVLFMVVIMFSFGCFVPVKRLAGKIVSESLVTTVTSAHHRRGDQKVLGLT